MYTIANNRVTFSYTRKQVQDSLEHLSAQLSLTLPPPTPDCPATDLLAITADEASTIDLLLPQTVLTAAEEFEKIGDYTISAELFTFSAPCSPAFAFHAPAADQHLGDWIAWHTLTLWLRLRHLDKPANQTMMRALDAHTALHRQVFYLR